jgi:hypothetical protein
VALALPYATARVRRIEQREQAQAAIGDLRMEGWRGLDDRSLGHAGQEEGFKHRRELILAGLARQHDCEDTPLPIEDRCQNGLGDLGLIGVERLAQDTAGEARDGGGLIGHMHL